MRTIVVFCFALLLTACDLGPKEHVIRVSGPTMGTQYHVAWVGTSDEIAGSLQEKIDARLKAINQSMSTYIADSELSKLNKGELSQDEAGWVAISSDLTQVLAISLEIWQQSAGRFDVTVGPLVNMWGFGPDARVEHAPDESLIAAKLASIGSQFIELDVSKQRVRLLKPLYIDLSAVAKGWAVDQIAELVHQEGINSYMVEIGGELITQGSKPDNQPWRIAIERPQQLSQDVMLVIEPNGLGVATSGSYRNYFEEKGTRYSHTIDPKTGHPITHKLVSVTVLQPQVGYADAWATAITVAGPDAGMELAETLKLPIFMIVSQGDNVFAEQASSEFKRLFSNALKGGK